MIPPESDEEEGSDSQTDFGESLFEPSGSEHDDVKEPVVEVDDVKEPVVEADEHKYWWLTRAGRQATCASCKRFIPPHTMRACYYPNPNSVVDKRVWSKLFWVYYHMSRLCLPVGDRAVMRREDVVVDVARLPKSSKEDLVAYHAAIEESLTLLCTEYEAARSKLTR